MSMPPREMFLAMFSTIPGFVDHGDGTWSITPRGQPGRCRRVRLGRRRVWLPAHLSVADKRREARARKQACSEPVVEHASLTKFEDGSSLFVMSGR